MARWAHDRAHCHRSGRASRDQRLRPAMDARPRTTRLRRRAPRGHRAGRARGHGRPALRVGGRGLQRGRAHDRQHRRGPRALRRAARPSPHRPEDAHLRHALPRPGRAGGGPRPRAVGAQRRVRPRHPPVPPFQGSRWPRPRRARDRRRAGRCRRRAHRRADRAPHPPGRRGLRARSASEPVRATPIACARSTHG